MANPDLDVWVVGGDGDLLAIGGNHLVHTLRRDVDLNILLFNNAIYGLTKGQASPASYAGTYSPSTPRGSAEAPVNAAMLALGSGAKFVARSADTRLDILSYTLKRAAAHTGTALVEIFQNCIVYNDGVWGGIGDKATRSERSIVLKNGQPLVFGSDGRSGLEWRAETGEFDIISGDQECVRRRATVFDETNFALATSIVRMDPADFPVALGVIYCIPDKGTPRNMGNSLPKPVMDRGALQNIVSSGAVWTIGSDNQ